MNKLPFRRDTSASGALPGDQEFLARYCNHPVPRLEQLRTGNPSEGIVDVAAFEHADLIALGWA